MTIDDLIVEPLVEGRHCHLRVIDPGDFDFLYHLLLEGPTAARWRFRGSVPEPQSFVERLWQGVAAQFMVVGAESHAPLGLVSAFGLDPEGRTAHLAIAMQERMGRTGIGVEALGLMVDYVFKFWDVRKVYGRVPEFNLDYFASGSDRLFDIEGCLREHLYFSDRYWDEYILAVSREKWGAVGRPMLMRAVGTRGR